MVVSTSVILPLMVHIASILGGVAIAWMGYMLWAVGVYGPEGERLREQLGHGWGLVVTALPGLCFMIVGAVIVLRVVWTGPNYNDGPRRENK